MIIMAGNSNNPKINANLFGVQCYDAIIRYRVVADLYATRMVNKRVQGTSEHRLATALLH